MKHDDAPSVVHVSPFGSPYSGNFVASLRALDAALRLRGSRLVYVLPDGARRWPWFAELRASGARIHVVSSHRNQIASAAALARIARRENGVVLHTHFYSFDVAARVARMVLRLMRHDVRVVWHLHASYGPAPSPLRRVKDFLKLRIIGSGAYVLAVSAEIRDEAVRRGFDEGHAGWLPNGIDLTRPTSPRSSREDVRASLGVAPHTTGALMFGWEPFTKGVDVAVDAVGRLHAAGHEVALLLVGEEPARTFVLEHCGGSIPDFVKLVPPRESVADLYVGADAFLSVSRREGMTYSVGEAMAAGLPVIVSDIPGQNWMREGNGAFFVTAGDAEQLAERLELVMRAPQAQRDAWSRDNRAASTDVSLERWVDGLFAFYRRILADASAEAPAAGP